MGCDIHLVVERRVEQRWVAVRIMRSISTAAPINYGMNFATPASKERNYDRFAALAGVRGPGPAPRGLPDDVSETSRFLFELLDRHTPSWLPLSEAAEIFAATERHELNDFDRKYSMYHYFNIEPETDGPAEDHRLVFWFDS